MGERAHLGGRKGCCARCTHTILQNLPKIEFHFSTVRNSTCCAVLPAALQAVEAGSKAVSQMCLEMEAWAAMVGKPKREDGRVLVPEGLDAKVAALAEGTLAQTYK